MRRPLALLTAALALGAVTAAPASATFKPENTPIGGGATTLALDAAVGRALAGAGISVAPVGPATASGAGIAFPITRGVLNDGSGAGRVEHSGGLTFAKGGASVSLTDFIVTIDRHPVLTAKVGDDRIAILDLDTDAARVSNSAFGLRVSNVDVALRGAAARALNAALGTTAFAGGLGLGEVTVDAKRSSITIEGGDTRLAVDAGAGAALASLGVRLDLVGPAFAAQDGRLAFPITRGVLGSDLAGQIAHRGGIRLSAGGRQIVLREFVVDTVRGVLTARTGGTRIDLLKLDLSAPQVTPVGMDDLQVANVPGRLTRTAADALNATFGVTAFSEDLLLGVATIKAVA
jgi:hypothetical protein